MLPLLENVAAPQSCVISTWGWPVLPMAAPHANVVEHPSSSGTESQRQPSPIMVAIFKKFTYLFLAVLGLRCGFSCGEQELLFSCHVQTSHFGGSSGCGGSLGHERFSGCPSQALEHRLDSCGAGA